jgi:hypothetical protein
VTIATYTKRRTYWIKLDSGQVALVADIYVVINPYSNDDNYAIYRNIKCPKIRPNELLSYGKALLAAGEWLGSITKD